MSAEIHRVLRAGGRLAMLEVIRLGSDELHCPAPWADGPAENFVASVSGIGLELLMPDYEARMGGLARKVETGRHQSARDR